MSSIYRSCPEAVERIKKIVDAAPPLTAAQLSRITAITGLVPVDQ